MKRVITLLLALVLLGGTAACSAGGGNAPAGAESAVTDGGSGTAAESSGLSGTDTAGYDESARLHTSGAAILTSGGKQVFLRGFGSAGGEFIMTNWNAWYNEKSFATLKDLGCNVFRLMVEINDAAAQGEAWADRYCRYVDRCVSQGLYVIVAWMGNADFEAHTDSALAFFDYMTDRYGDDPRILYEILNEPFDRSWKDIRAYVDKVVPAIREKAPSALVIVPTGYGYRGEKSNAAVIEDPIPYDNVLYQEHMYVGATLKSGFLQETAALTEAGYPVIFTEWGATDANGRDNFYPDYTLAFLDFCERHGISWCNFQLSDFTPRKGQIYQSSVCLPGLWTNSLAEDTLSDSGKLIKAYFANGSVPRTASVMMNYTEGYAFWDDAVRTKVNTVRFVRDNGYDGPYDKKWDVSMSQGSWDVTAYLKGTELYVVAKVGPVLAPRSNDYVFKNFAALKELSLENYDTTYSNYTNALFSGCTSLERIDLSNYGTSCLTTLCSEFLNCHSLKEIDLRNCDLSNVSSLQNAFYNCYSLEKLYLPDLDMAKITNVENVFRNAGRDVPATEIFTADASDAEAVKQAAREAGVRVP